MAEAPAKHKAFPSTLQNHRALRSSCSWCCRGNRMRSRASFRRASWALASSKPVSDQLTVDECLKSRQIQLIQLLTAAAVDYNHGNLGLFEAQCANRWWKQSAVCGHSRNAQHRDSMIGTSRSPPRHSNRRMRAQVPRCGDRTSCRVQPCSQIDFPGGFRRIRRGWPQIAAHCEWRLMTLGSHQNYFLSL